MGRAKFKGMHLRLSKKLDRSLELYFNILVVFMSCDS